MLPSIKKILYATDLSENSRLAFGYAASLAKQYLAELIVVHAIEPLNPKTVMQMSGALGEMAWLNLQTDVENAQVDNLGAKLREFCRDMQTDMEALNLKDENLVLSKGNSVDSILSAASENKVDLIVMGTHGYSMMKDALMGGTARRVVRRSKIPVLVVRSQEEE